MDKEVSNVITKLRVICTVIIVFYHAVCPYGVWGIFSGTMGGIFSSLDFTNLVFQRCLGNITLPMFFCLSGMLFWGRRGYGVDSLSYFWKKFDRLIIPAALVSLACSFFDIPVVGYASPKGHLWFVYVLFFYFSLALIFRKTRIHVYMLLSICMHISYVFLGKLEIEFSPIIFQILRYNLYFTCGYYLIQYYTVLRKNYVRWPLFLSYLVFFWLNFQSVLFFLFNLLALAFIPQGKIVNRMIKSLNENSFGIYLIHHVLMIALLQEKFIYQSYEDYPLLAMPCMVLLILSISWLLSFSLHKIKFSYF